MFLLVVLPQSLSACNLPLTINKEHRLQRSNNLCPYGLILPSSLLHLSRGIPIFSKIFKNNPNIYLTKMLISQIWMLFILMYFGTFLVSINAFSIPMDPETDIPNQSAWPLGKYALPASMFGCPETGWIIQYINLSLPTDDIYWTTTYVLFRCKGDHCLAEFNNTSFLQILGPYSTRSFQINFCGRNDTNQNSPWPVGNYCLFGTENQCPKGFKESIMAIKGQNVEARGFMNGVNNTGDIFVPFCCQDNARNLSLDTLPNDFPFVLIKGSSYQPCPRMKSMTVHEETIYLPKNIASLSGSLPELLMTNTHLGLTFCYYQPNSTQEQESFENFEIYSFEKPIYTAPNLKLYGTVVYDFGLTRFRLYSVHRPWIQIDLQQFVKVYGVSSNWYFLPAKDEYVLVYISMEQWDFFNRGAKTCNFCKLNLNDRPINKCACRRPITGQYVTLVIENIGQTTFLVVSDIDVYGSGTGCGKHLGMITGDIKEYQLVTSSNQRDIRFIRALFGRQGWCSHENDIKPWLMIDLIVSTKVQAVILYGWFQQEKTGLINKFTVEYGVMKNNLSFYSEENGRPKVFNVNAEVNVNSFKTFWFWKLLVARYIKINVVDLDKSRACMKVELVGCPIYTSRSSNCNGEKSLVDLGFARIQGLKFKGSDKVKTICEKDTASLLECQNKTISYGYIGNSFDNKTKICCFVNISMDNRHFRDLWKTVESDSAVVSERLCLAEITSELSNMSIIHVGSERGTLLSPMFPSNYPRGIKMRFKLDGHKQYIKLTIVYVSLAETATMPYLRQIGNTDINRSYCKDNLAIDIGTKKNIMITYEDQKEYRYASFISSEHHVNIILTTCFQYKLADGLMFQLQYETVDYPGCGFDGSVHMECKLKSAYVGSYLYPSIWTTSESNTWKLEGQPGQYIELYIIDLHVVGLTRNDTFIEIFDLDKSGERRESLGRIYNTLIHKTLKSSWHRMEIEYSIGSGVTGRGFFGRYETKGFQPFQNFANERCNPGQYWFQQSCYTFSNISYVNHHRAEKECKNDGSHLVAIGSEDEQKFIFSILLHLVSSKSTTDFSVHIGLLKQNSSKLFTDFRWTNGETMVYTAWFEGSSRNFPQPDGFQDELCTAMVFNSGHNVWNWHDILCGYSRIHFFVCEKEMTVNKTETDYSWTISHETQGFESELNSYLFECNSGEIVSFSVICDCFRDCSDNSDENNCNESCNANQFQCGNGGSIHWTHYCDHVRHCKDGSDEDFCLNGCSRSVFQCNEGFCLPFKYQCDGIVDCSGKKFEDERYTPVINSANRCPRFRYTQRSCEEWWRVGARNSGTYMLHLTDAVQVICKFEIIDDRVNVRTYFISKLINFKPGGYLSNTILRLFFSDPAYNCRQTIDLMCYYQDIVDFYLNFTMAETSTRECCHGRSQCMGGTNWTNKDINTPLSDRITLTDKRILPIRSISYSEKNFSKESFSTVEVGPVVCESNISVNSTSDTRMCKNGVMYNLTDHCILYKDYAACRDLSHVQYCEHFPCPSGFYKCPKSFCISSEMVCDGIKHCQHGNDELNCGILQCPGLFRCQRSTTCLTIDKVCDGNTDCPMRDDEFECDSISICPPGCSCSMNVLVCQHTDVRFVYNSATKNVRKLDLSHSNFIENNFSIPDYQFLGELILHNCSIQTLSSASFSKNFNLLYLDLSYNAIEILLSRTFSGLEKLRILNITGNFLLHTIEPYAFLSLHHITKLNFTNTKLKIVGKNTFVGLKSLQFLDISRNMIKTINDYGFNGLESLQHIDMTHNVIETIPVDVFTNLSVLKTMRTDSYLFCCLKPESVSHENCHPQKDEFSSCGDLMKSDILRISLWIIGLSALIGNACVICYRLTIPHETLRKPHGFFVLNLSISDSLMGIYLIIIAVADVYFKGDYVFHDRRWRKSLYCMFAGVLSMVSSEASVTFLMLTSIDCLLKVKYPFGGKHITMTWAKIASIICWLVVVFLSILPVVYTTYFSEEFYSRTAVCLALPFSRRKTYGWEYSAAIFIFYNSMAFLTIVVCQNNIYKSANSSNRVIARNSRQDIALARRLFFVVLTDFLCWFPIGLMGIFALGGHDFSSDVYLWVAVFVLPINSALNPLLYTFSIVMKEKIPALRSLTAKVMNKSTIRRKRNRRLESEYKALIVLVDRRDDLYLECRSVRELVGMRRLKPKESYFLLSTVVCTVAYLHQNGYTLTKSINPDSVIAMIKNEKIVQIKIISPKKSISCESESDKDIEDIGTLTRFLLRNTNQIPKK